MARSGRESAALCTTWIATTSTFIHLNYTYRQCNHLEHRFSNHFIQDLMEILGLRKTFSGPVDHFTATLLVDVLNNLVWRESFSMFASPIVIHGITMPLIVSLLA